MAWIESHETLRAHPKLKKLARTLKIHTAQAIGHLHCLWWWSMNYAPNGDLTNFDPEDIADGAAWDGDPQELIDALLSCGVNGVGFLEKINGQLFLHDWDRYIGKLLDARQSDRERKRQSRAKTGQDAEPPRDGQEMSESCPPDVRRMSTGQDAEPPRDGGRTVPNRTVPNRTKDITPPISPPRGEEGAEAEDQGPLAENSSEDGEGARSGTRRNGKGAEYTAEFEAFFAVYPRRLRKQEAFATWKNRKREGVDIEAVIAAATAYGKAMAYLGKGPDVILHPKTFLNENRWKDWLPPDGAAYLEARELAKRRAEAGGNGRKTPDSEPSPTTYEEAKALMERKERERGGATTYEEAKAAMVTRLRANDNVIDADFRRVGDGGT